MPLTINISYTIQRSDENPPTTTQVLNFTTEGLGQRMSVWLSEQYQRTCQLGERSAIWIKNSWKTCHATVIAGTKTAPASPTTQKVDTTFQTTVEKPPGDVRLPDAEKFANATVAFAHELCAKLSSETQGKSFAVSPVSILAALGMCLNIIQKEKQAAFIKKIGLGPLSVEEANAAIGSALKSLLLPESFKEGSIEIAQSLVAKKDISFDPQFLALLKQVYDSEMISGDDLKTLVNEWVSNKTHGNIKELLTGDCHDLAFALVNAVYLNLNWKKAFLKPEGGWPVQQFTCADNTTAPVSMMSQVGRYKLYENETFSMLEVPYKAPNGKSLSQLIFLPKQGASLETVEASMDKEMISRCRKDAARIRVEWHMPKLRAESSFELLDILKSMGIPLHDIDQSKCSAEVFVGKVVHKTVVSNSEEGTVASAATAICLPETAAMPEELKTFIVDRNYAYLIMDQDTILFRGRVSDASSLVVDKQA